MTGKKSSSKKTTNEKVAPKTGAKKTTPKTTGKKVLTKTQDIEKKITISTPNKSKTQIKSANIATTLIHQNTISTGVSEQYMTTEHRTLFRDMLINWKNELQAEVVRTLNHMQDESSKFPDITDKATQEEEFAIELRTRDRERKLLRKIEQTLDRIEQDDFGYCAQCGIEIGIERLKARPTATLCIDCKHIDEIREKQLIG